MRRKTNISSNTFRQTFFKRRRATVLFDYFFRLVQLASNLANPIFWFCHLLLQKNAEIAKSYFVEPLIRTIVDDSVFGNSAKLNKNGFILPAIFSASGEI